LAIVGFVVLPVLRRIEMSEAAMNTGTQELVSEALESFNDPALELRHLLEEYHPITVSMSGW
jgi:hypothetical protein